MSYSGVKRLVEERPDWIPVIKECLSCAQQYKEFSGSWVLSGAKVWKPGLRTLVTYRILERTKIKRSRRGAYYIMPDPEGTKEALVELGVLKNDLDNK